jgi:MFS family permease
MLSFLLAQGSTGGPKYLGFLLAWLIGAAVGGYLSERKGYGDRPGLVTGLCLSAAALVIWLLIPARDNSDWKLKGPWGSERKDQPGTAAAAEREAVDAEADADAE